MVILGSIVHKFSLKNYVVTGVLVSSLSYMFFPIFYSLTSVYNLVMIMVCMSIFGFFQAAVYPGLMGVLGNWLDRKKNGILMAVWVMSGNVGNIYASSTCNVLEDYKFSWIVNFMVTGLTGLMVATIIFTFLK
jgi:sugar phosphate permease